MDNEKQKTSLIVKIQLGEKLVEKLLIVLISSFLSFTGGTIYASQNIFQESDLSLDKTTVISPKLKSDK